MPDPQAHPHQAAIGRTARIALVAGVAIMALKFIVFGLTNSAAVLSDALESIINIMAAGFMLFSVWLSNRPADRDHPYGHGKVEFMTLGLEGWMILAAGLTIGYVAIARLLTGDSQLQRLDAGMWMLAAVNLLNGTLAAYVLWMGKRYASAVLIADGKHLLTDFASTAGVLLGLLLVRWTGKPWLDPVIALVMAALILFTSWKLLWQSIDGLMDRTDPRDQARVLTILDDEIRRGTIHGYHKVRLRHTGRFHWIDLHLQVDATLTVAESHDVASRIEYRIEQMLNPANATAHIEPFIPDAAPPASPQPPAAVTDALSSVTPRLPQP